MKLKEILSQYIDHQKEFFSALKQRSTIHSQNRDYTNLYQQVHLEAEPIFVLSTGRAGTKLLTKVLDADKSIHPVHEPYPELSYHSKVAFQNPKSDAAKAQVDVARYELIRDAFLLDKRYVETNNRITFFAYALADLYPKARFIHLVRNPIDFIKSGCARGWYTGKVLHDEGRISNAKLFESYSQEEKVAWLWASTNGFVEAFKQTHPSRCYTVKSEDLFEGSMEVYKVFEDLGFNIDESHFKRISETKINAGASSSKTKTTQTTDIGNLRKLKEIYGYE